MIVGLNTRQADITINVCKEKKQTNVRAITDVRVQKLIPALKLSLEQALDFINKDELVEVTPVNIRLRKKLLTETQRLKDRRAANREE